MSKRYHKKQKKYETRTLDIRRVAKVTSGGRRLSFSAMVVCGDRRGRVGVALGKGADVRSAIEKGERLAEKYMKKIDLVADTIPHSVEYKFKAAEIIMRPAREGTGVIAGSAPRAVLELAGVENVYVKQLGSRDVIANTYCTFEALQELRSGRVLRKMTKMQKRAEEHKKKKSQKGKKSSRKRRKKDSFKQAMNKKKKSKSKKSKSKKKDVNKVKKEKKKDDSK